MKVRLALGHKLFANPNGKRNIRQLTSMQMSDLALTNVKKDHAPAMRFNRHPGPGGHFIPNPNRYRLQRHAFIMRSRDENLHSLTICDIVRRYKGVPMRNPIRRFAFAALILMAIAVPAYSQQGAITGTIIDRDGKPLVNAVVTFDRSDLGQHFETKTNSKGFYNYRVDSGVYRVTVLQNGNPITGADNVRVNFSDNSTLNFDLRSLDKQQAKGGAAAPPVDKATKDAENRANSETNGAFNAGVTALTAGNYDEALQQFLIAAERRPNLAVIHMRLGATYTAQAKFNEAANAYKKATEVSPDATTFNAYGIAAIQASRMDEGRAAILKAAELDPAHGGTAFMNLGMLLAGKQMPKEAREAFQKSIALNPNGADSYYQLGLVDLQDPTTTADAVTQFEKYQKLAPKGEYASTIKDLIDAAKAATPKK